MKATTSALLFAGVAAAGEYYDAKSTSSSKLGYTTVYPGYGKHPVTVTSQYQPIPTYYPNEYDSKTGSWSEYPWVSTVITDCDGKKTTITNVEDKVTVYHTTSTITKTTCTTDAYVPAPTGYGAYKKNETSTKTYYELYEKVYEVKYKELGPKALHGYPGSGLWKDDKYQPVDIKEYKDGKWVTKHHIFTYGEPKPTTTKFDKPGTYTIPASDITVDKPYTAACEASYTAPAGKEVTYGGITITVAKPTTVTCAYPAEETHYNKTETVLKYKTITCPSAGEYEVAKPTTTSYDHSTTVLYTTVTVYETGVYHHAEETVTVTKTNEPYTCSYKKESYPTSAYPTDSYPTSVYPTDSYPTSVYPEDSYPTSAYPEDSYPTSVYPEDSYPTTSGYHNGSYPTTTSCTDDESYPTSVYSDDSYPTSVYPEDSYPTSVYPDESYPTTTSCTGDKTHPTSVYPEDSYPTSVYPEDSYPTSVYPDESYPTSVYPDESYPTSVYPEDSYPTSVYPDESYPTTTSCTGKETYPTKSSDPSASYPEPTESYGTPSAGYVKRGGVFARRAAAAAAKKAQAGKRVVLV